MVKDPTMGWKNVPTAEMAREIFASRTNSELTGKQVHLFKDSLYSPPALQKALAEWMESTFGGATDVEWLELAEHACSLLK